MKKLIVVLLLAAAPVLGFAAGGGAHLDDANIDVSDQASLQRGCQDFRQLLPELPLGPVPALQPYRKGPGAHRGRGEGEPDVHHRQVW